MAETTKMERSGDVKSEQRLTRTSKWEYNMHTTCPLRRLRALVLNLFLFLLFESMVK